MNGRPLILVDVDGVIRIWASAAERKRRCYHEGWRQCRAWNGGEVVRVCFNPETGPRLARLARLTGGELAWASMWEMWANISIAPMIGLPPMPVGPAVEGWYTTGFKADSIVPWTAGRPFVWFEDEQDEVNRASKLAAGQPHLMIKTEGADGLEDRHFREAQRWLERRR